MSSRDQVMIYELYHDSRLGRLTRQAVQRLMTQIMIIESKMINHYRSITMKIILTEVLKPL